MSSPELTGGAGFSFEASVTAHYLASLLVEGGVRGLGEYICQEVQVQRGHLGDPLDDIIVLGRDRHERTAKLSLQAKHSLTISSAETNTDFRETIERAWATLEAKNFERFEDRVGIAFGQAAQGPLRDAQVSCEWARNSASEKDFFQRILTRKVASDGQRAFIATIRTIVRNYKNVEPDEVLLWRFLRAFTFLRFDVRAEGAADDSSAIERLSVALTGSGLHDVAQLRSVLVDIARDLAATAGSESRSTLLDKLTPRFALAALPSYRDDLRRVAEETRHSLSGIRLDVAGEIIERTSLMGETEKLLRKHRYVQLTGEPGTGKSSLLRALAERHLKAGFAFVLRSDRLVGPGWPALATHLRLTTSRLRDLLSELASSSSAILYIDGIDRVAGKERETVRDLIQTILDEPALADWRIVASVRSGNLEHMRTWLPEALLRQNDVATLTVYPFDDNEARQLSVLVPRLEPLLFGTQQVREIARRPFFLSVLATSFPLDQTVPKLSSEPELAEAWWGRGGYDADPPEARSRKHALLSLAKSGRSRLGRNVAFEGQDASSVGGLIQDGILTESPYRHEVSFSHDIFFEWTFFILLRGQGDRWFDEIRDAGEPPMLGRVIELLSQTEFEEGMTWQQTLLRLETESARSQWNRAWLLAPLDSPRFGEHAKVYTATLESLPQRRQNLLVWFQAVRTTPNPLVLDGHYGDMDKFKRLRMADAMGWPRDAKSWQRMLLYLFEDLVWLRIELVPDLLTLIDVWTNAFSQIPNLVSSRVVALVGNWLREVEEVRHLDQADDMPENTIHWTSTQLCSLEELEERLRTTFLKASVAYPEALAKYLERLVAQPDVRSEVFQQLLPWSPTIAKSQPALLAQLTQLELLEELPDDRMKKNEGDFGWYPQFDEDSSPGIQDRMNDFHPASPLQEPFHSLFRHAPDEALALVRRLSTHMMAAWRQLKKFDRMGFQTPLPLVLEFPWGREEYWGDRRVYLWFRGAFASTVIQSFLMALEEWVFAQIEAGADVDETIRSLISNNPCAAVLGIAVTIAIQAKRVSPTTAPLLSSQRIWLYDVGRFAQIDGVKLYATQIGLGLRRESESHVAAIARINSRPSRNHDVRYLVVHATFSGSPLDRDRIRAAIKQFPANLPFEYQEETEIPEIRKLLAETAEVWAALGEEKNYRVERLADETHAVVFENPAPQTERAKQAGESLQSVSISHQITEWAKRELKSDKTSLPADLSNFIEEAKKRQAIPADDHFQGPMWRTAIAAVAAVVLKFSGRVDSADLNWAYGALETAKTLRLSENLYNDPGGWISDEDPAYAAIGYSAVIQAGIGTPQVKEMLLELVAHRSHKIASAALSAALGCWSADRTFAWVAFRLSVELCSVSQAYLDGIHLRQPGEYPSSFHDASEWSQNPVALANAKHDLKTGLQRSESLPVPAAWSHADHHEDGRQEDPSDDDDDWLFDWERCSFVLKALPLKEIRATEFSRDLVFQFAEDLLGWTAEKFSPPWTRNSDKRLKGSPPLVWRGSFIYWLVALTEEMPVSEIMERFISPLAELPQSPRIQLLGTFLQALVAAVMDAETLRSDRVELIARCFEIVSSDRIWDRVRAESSKKLTDDHYTTARMMLLDAGRPCEAAKRFANGDWSQIQQAMVLVNGVVATIGDLAPVLTMFLDLVERSFENYALDDFISQIESIPVRLWASRSAWNNSFSSSKLAALIQNFAEREKPLSPANQTALLRVLDKLIEVGDRRSAALQTSQIFMTA